jgi:hypothetical protein
VLAHVAYALPPITREERAPRAKVLISEEFNSKQQVFLDFVLSHYVSVGVEELDQEKLSPLLRLKYHNSNDKRLYGGPYPFVQTGDISRADHWVTEHTQTYNQLGLAQPTVAARHCLRCDCRSYRRRIRHP